MYGLDEYLTRAPDGDDDVVGACAFHPARPCVDTRDSTNLCQACCDQDDRDASEAADEDDDASHEDIDDGDLEVDEDEEAA